MGGNRGCAYVRDIEYRISDVPECRGKMEYPACTASGIRRTLEPEVVIGRDGNSRRERPIFFCSSATSSSSAISRRPFVHRADFATACSTRTPIYLIELPTRARQGVGDEVPVVQVCRLPPGLIYDPVLAVMERPNRLAEKRLVSVHLREYRAVLIIVDRSTFQVISMFASRSTKQKANAPRGRVGESSGSLSTLLFRDSAYLIRDN